MKQVIAIDGPSGAGKSTIARLLAAELGFDYLDTGALYRAVGLGLSQRGVGEEAPDDEITSALRGMSVAFAGGKVLLNGNDVSVEIRSPEASHFASVFSARGPVRAFLLETQRQAALKSDLVAEGRDMTTVVFPGSRHKFFLDASVEERTRRRVVELKAKGFDTDEERVRVDILERDTRDSSRDIAPLRKADDARVIDTTGLTIDQVCRKLTELIGTIPQSAARRKS